MYVRTSVALVQSALLWKNRKNVPVEEDANYDNEIVEQLRNLKEAGKNKTKDEIRRELNDSPWPG